MNGNILMGVGNDMDGDDGAGPYAYKYASEHLPRGWKAINAENVPENYTAVIRRERPELLVILDAADMGMEPGEIRRIPKEKIGLLTMSTHSMPLSIFMGFLEESAGRVVLVGIQADKGNLNFGDELGEYMKESARKAVDMIFNGMLDDIPEI